MRAAVLYGKEDVRIQSVPVPALKPGEILVRVGAALTCGTDLKTYKRGYHAKMLVPPALFGHEFSGEIAAVGFGVPHFKVGDRVVSANSAPCGDCYYCKRNQPNLCDSLTFNNGAYAEYIRVPARIVAKNTYRLADDLEYRDAALAEPLACALRGVEESGVKPGDTVIVMGLGPLGLMLVRLAYHAYGARVIAVARRVVQIDAAIMMGASIGISLGEDRNTFLAQLMDETEGRGADVVIEATGQPQSWELATRMVRRGGTVNFFSGCPSGTTVNLETELLHYSEITCKASFHHTPDHFRRALGYITDGTVRASHFVTHQEPLDQLPRVLDELAHRRTGQIKTAIIP